MAHPYPDMVCEYKRFPDNIELIFPVKNVKGE
jgi:hypothetical protein